MSAAKEEGSARDDFDDVPLPEIRVPRRLPSRAARRHRVGRGDRRPIPAWLWVYLALAVAYLCGLFRCGR